MSSDAELLGCRLVVPCRPAVPVVHMPSFVAICRVVWWGPEKRCVVIFCFNSLIYNKNIQNLNALHGNGAMESAGNLLGAYGFGSGLTCHNLLPLHDRPVMDGLLATNDCGATVQTPYELYDEGISNIVSPDPRDTFFSERAACFRN